MIVNTDEVSKAKSLVNRARDDLSAAFVAWDETVSAMQMAWIVVRKAQKHVIDADAILHKVLDDAEKANP